MGVTAWVDQNGGTAGTELDAANLNADTAADTVEAATNDTLGSGSTYVNNLNRIRYWMGQMGLGAWNALQQAIPLSQKGVATGVASLDVNGHVVQPGSVNPMTAGLASGLATLDTNSRVVESLAKGVRQIGWAYCNGAAYIGSQYQNSGMTFSAPWGCMFQSGNMVVGGCLSWGVGVPSANGSGNNFINVTTTGGIVLVVMMMSAYNWLSPNANWLEVASCIDGGALSLIDNTVTSAADFNYSAGSGNGKPPIPPLGWETFGGMAYHVGLSAGAHTLVPCFKAGGGGGITQAVGFNPNADGGKSYFNMLVLELA